MTEETQQIIKAINDLYGRGYDKHATLDSLRIIKDQVDFKIKALITEIDKNRFK